METEVLEPDPFLNESGHIPEAMHSNHFHADGEAEVNWVLSRLGAIQAEKDRIREQFGKRLQQLDNDYNALLFRFGGEIEQFARAELKDARRRSLVLLQGTLAFRKVPATIYIKDPEAALAHAKAAGFEGCVRVREELAAAEYSKQARQALDETGELLPGADLAPEHDNFRIDVTGRREK